MIPGFEKSDGTRHYPVTAMVANLAKSTPEKPALMRHDDVVTFFHEMGHVVHGLLSEAKYGRIHGTRCGSTVLWYPLPVLIVNFVVSPVTSLGPFANVGSLVCRILTGELEA